MSYLLQAIIASIIVSLLSLIGGFVLIKRVKLSPKQLMHLISFAAGVMLAVSFLDLLPESMHDHAHQNYLSWSLVGVVAFFVLSKIIHQFHCHHPEKHQHPTALKISIGDSLHNFFDGIAIIAAFSVSPATGWLATLAISAHEIPQEIADLSVLLKSGLRPIRALTVNLISGLTAVLGVFVGYLGLGQTSTLQPIFLALTAGMFIYIALADLIPELESTHDRRPIAQIIPFFIGLFLSALLIKTTHRYIDVSHSEPSSESSLESDSHPHEEAVDLEHIPSEIIPEPHF